ncbi:MAG TPA: NAD-dependent epimerase/dehydratase family protein, partial [Candidatus Kryptonia bacterium]|nr:NAD-dependent epimerase/dehydratase family protein [Candidatus Kryptonia bacterium]
MEQLVARGTPVVALDSLEWGRESHLSPFSEFPGFQFERADIRDRDAIGAIFGRHRPAAVIHLAALHYIPAAVKDPVATVAINVLGTQTILSAADAVDVESFLLASTGDVYAPSDTPHREGDRLAPFNIYGLSKLCGEQLIALASDGNAAMRFVVARLFNLYGPRETNPHILPEIIAQLRNGSRQLRLGNIWPKRDLVPVRDAARALIELVQCAPAGVTTTNVATGRAWSIDEAIRIIGELLAEPIEVISDPAKTRASERP